MKGKSAVKPSVGNYLYQHNQTRENSGSGTGLRTPVRATEKTRNDSVASKDGKVTSLRQLLTKSNTPKGVNGI